MTYSLITPLVMQAALQAVANPAPVYKPPTSRRADWRKEHKLSEKQLLPSEEYFLRYPGWSPYNPATRELADKNRLKELSKILKKEKYDMFLVRNTHGEIIAIINDSRPSRLDRLEIALDVPSQEVLISDQGIRLRHAATIESLAEGTITQTDTLPFTSADSHWIQLTGHSKGIDCTIAHADQKRSLDLSFASGGPHRVEFKSEARNTKVKLINDDRLTQCRQHVLCPSNMVSGATIEDGKWLLNETPHYGRTIREKGPHSRGNGIQFVKQGTECDANGKKHSFALSVYDKVNGLLTELNTVSYHVTDGSASLDANAFNQKLREAADASRAGAAELAARSTPPQKAAARMRR